MAESMVEKVARAICAAGDFCCQNTETVCTAMDVYEDRARAAIEAMREPDEQMKAAGWDDLKDYVRTAEWMIADVWTAMIDAALEPIKSD